MVLLDSEDRLLRPSIQQSDGRSGAQVQQMRCEMDSQQFLERAGNGINQQLVGAKIRWIEHHEPEVFERIATVFGSYDLLTGSSRMRKSCEQELGAEAGLLIISSNTLDDELIAFAHLPRYAVPRLVRSHDIIGAVTAQAAAWTGLS